MRLKRRKPNYQSRFRSRDATSPEANGLNAVRLVVKLRCYFLSLLRIHRPDCEHCRAREKCGLEMRERLAELKRRTQSDLPKEEVHGGVGVGSAFTLRKGGATPPTPSSQPGKNARVRFSCRASGN